MMAENVLNPLASLTNALYASDMLDAMATITAKINRVDMPTIRLDPLTIYCNKTGQPIGARTTDAIFDAIQFHGKQHFCEIAHRAHGLNSAPAWVASNPEALDRLIEHDPCGYAAYSLGVICDKFTNKPVRYDANAIVAHHYALARAYAIIRNAHAGDAASLAIVELNYKFVELLTYGESVITRIIAQLDERGKMPDSLAMLAVNGTLEHMIDDAINKAMAVYDNFDLVRQYPGKRFESVARTPADAARGPSNVRGQSRSKMRVANRMKVLKLMQEFGNLGFGGSVNSPIGTKPGDIYSQVMNASQRHDPVLDKLAKIDFDKWADIDIGDILANTVEVRTISREEADIIIAADMFPDLTEAPPPDAYKPVVSPFAILAAKVEAQAIKPEPAKSTAFGALFATMGKAKGGVK